MADKCEGKQKAWIQIESNGQLFSTSTQYPPYQEIPSQRSVGGLGYPSYSFTGITYKSGRASMGNCAYQSYAKSGKYGTAKPAPFEAYIVGGTQGWISFGGGSALVASVVVSSGCNASTLYSAAITGVQWIRPPDRTEYRLSLVDAQQQVLFDSGWVNSPPTIKQVICGCKVDLELECGSFPTDFCCLDCNEVQTKADQILARLP